MGAEPWSWDQVLTPPSSIVPTHPTASLCAQERVCVWGGGGCFTETVQLPTSQTCGMCLVLENWKPLIPAIIHIYVSSLMEGLHVNSSCILFQRILNAKKIQNSPFFLHASPLSLHPEDQTLQINGYNFQLSFNTTQIKEAYECVTISNLVPILREVAWMNSCPNRHAVVLWPT